ncbi:RPA-related protein RADX isoform X2 [Coregonus clupeaformis]|uniref:RPA-related protein RADX isoform X2 n=1 Tax=Coregonus clupeaformis TaxID=59861 RepID=UPI001BE0D7FA|nr:RPA-related protein RADX isoform X2 [Coregonus clupeaformis]
MACCALMMPEEVENISSCSDPLTGNNPNSFLHSTLEQFFTAKTLTLKMDKTDAVAVIGLQRYLTEQQNVRQQQQQPPDSYSYDMTVTDGVWQAKCILDRSLNNLIHKNIIRSGIDINITQCSFVYNERRLGQGCVCIEKIEHGSKESNVLRKIKDLDSLPMLSKDGFGNIVALQSDSPLQVGRKHYLSLWNNEDPEGRVWVPDVPPSDVVLDVSKMTLLCDLESSLGCMFRPLPLIVRVIHKSRLRYYGKPGLKIDYPYQAYFEVADQSGTMSLVLWNELCPEWYQRLNVGTVLYLQNYTLKQSYQNRSRPHIDNHRMKSFHSVEMCLNPRNPTAVLTVVPAKSVPPQWGLPEVSYQFAIRSELESLASNSACDVIGLVTFVSRVERIKNKGNTGPEKYWTYRWVHAVDGTSNIPFILEIFASSQPEIFNGIYPMTYLVCTQMRKCQEQDSLPYLTSSCETQIFTTGYHKGQPYVSDPRVKSFIQWTKTLKDSVMLKKTVVGGHYCFPHAPLIFTQSVADGSAQVPLVAANELKSEMEGLHYREHKRLAIQGQIMAVQYVTWPEETLSDQTVQSVVTVPDPPSDQRTVEVTETPINRETSSSSVQSSPSRRKRKQPKKRVMKRCYITRARMQEKREAGHGLTEEELSEQEEESDSESEEEEVGPLERNPDQTRASGQQGPSDIPQSEGATGERAVADCDWTSWESSSWPKQRQEVLEYLHPGGVYSESLSQRFRFDDKTLLLQQSNLHAARWTPEQTTDTLSPVTCKGYYKITILGINQQMAIDAAFVPVMSSGDPRSLGLPQDPHDNTLLSCLSAGFICPLADPLSQSEVALPEPEEILATAEELKDTHFVCILDLCHLGGDKLEVIITKVYRMTDIALV